METGTPSSDWTAPDNCSSGPHLDIAQTSWVPLKEKTPIFFSYCDKITASSSSTYLNVFQIVAGYGNDDAARRDAFGHFDLANNARFGVLDRRIFHVLVHLSSVAPHSAVKGHVQFAAAKAVRRARPADGMSGVGVGDGAGECRIDDGLDGAAGVHELPSDGQLGTSRKRPPNRVDGFNDGIDKFVIVGRFAFKVGDADDDRPSPRFARFGAVNEADDPSRLDVEFLEGVARHAGHRDASRYVGKCLAQIDTLDRHVSAAFPRAQSRVETFHLSSVNKEQ